MLTYNRGGDDDSSWFSGFCKSVCVCVFVTADWSFVLLNLLPTFILLLVPIVPFSHSHVEVPGFKSTSKSKTIEAHVSPREHRRINRMLAECPLQLYHSLSALPSASPETSFEKARAGPKRCMAVPFAGCRGFLLGVCSGGSKVWENTNELLHHKSPRCQGAAPSMQISAGESPRMNPNEQVSWSALNNL